MLARAPTPQQCADSARMGRLPGRKPLTRRKPVHYLLPMTAENAPRCDWARKPIDIAYHDLEWGAPVHDDRLLLEFLILEGAQAGLSWSTILAKRQGYRKAFANFDARKIARFDERKIEALLLNPGIVRNRLKI